MSLNKIDKIASALTGIVNVLRETIAEDVLTKDGPEGIPEPSINSTVSFGHERNGRIRRYVAVRSELGWHLTGRGKSPISWLELQEFAGNVTIIELTFGRAIRCKRSLLT